MKFVDYKCLESLLIEGEEIATEGLFTKPQSNQNPLFAKFDALVKSAISATYVISDNPKDVSDLKVVKAYLKDKYFPKSDFEQDVNIGAAKAFYAITSKYAMEKKLDFHFTVGSIDDKYKMMWVNIIDNKYNRIVAVLVGSKASVDKVTYANMLKWYIDKNK